MSRRGVRNYVRAQPIAQNVVHVLAGPPWRVVVEQQSDDRLDRDDAHETVFIPQSLVDEATKAPKTIVLLGAQFRPRIAEHRFWIAQREQRLTWHVPPAFAVAGIDQRVKRP